MVRLLLLRDAGSMFSLFTAMQWSSCIRRSPTGEKSDQDKCWRQCAMVRCQNTESQDWAAEQERIEQWIAERESRIDDES